MTHARWLVLVPFLGMLGGPFVLNRVEPMVLGMPLLLAWLVACVAASSAVMGVIYLCDPANRRETGQEASQETGQETGAGDGR